MSAPSAIRVVRQAMCSNIRLGARSQYAVRSSTIATTRRTTPAVRGPMAPSRSFSASVTSRAGLMPDTPDPQPPNNEPHEHSLDAAPLDDDTYHQIADVFMDAVNEKAEALQETREDVEVDYSAGVLSITFPPNGTYIINKQPPNKQIWLSSPVSGPKRFDWVVAGEGMHQKEGSGAGEWIYLRDGSKFSDVLIKELGLSIDPTEEKLQQSTDPTE